MEQITALSNPPAERALVGSAMLSPASFDDANAGSDDFEIPHARIAWQAIAELRRSGHAVSPISVQEQIRTNRGPSDLMPTLLDWASSVPHSERATELGAIVRGAAMARRLAASCSETLARLQSGAASAGDALAEHRATVASIESADGDDPAHVPDAMATVLETIADRRGNPAAHAIPTGIRDLDALIGGLKPKNQIVIAARPGQGKSAIRMQICINAAMAGFPVLLFSLEMSLQEEIERVLSGRSEISVNRLASGRISQGDVQRVYDAAVPFGRKTLPLWIYDKPVRLDKQESITRRWHARHVKRGKMSIVATDYIGLLRSMGIKGRTREQDIAAISQAGKALASQLDCVSVQVAQLNRESEKEQRDPRLSDLRESGSIEQDANMVLFPVRDMANEDKGRGKARLIIAKNRSGPTGEVELIWNGKYTRFEDMEAGPELPVSWNEGSER